MEGNTHHIMVGFFYLKSPQKGYIFSRKGIIIMKTVKGDVAGKKSQSALLRQLIRQAFISVGTGAVLLFGFIIFNIGVSAVHSEQLNTTIALNRYRIGSKTLTNAVQSYVVTAEEEYYAAYMKELNEDQNREHATATLKTCGLTDEEWASLNRISSLSENLVPLEEAAIAYVKEGALEEARACVFSAEYADSIKQITVLTDETIENILARKDKNELTLRFLQISFEILFALSFIYVILQLVKTIKFADRELLQPIIKVSDQMAVLAKGDFHTALEMEEDESEVGKMVSSISFMRQNLHGMVKEISGILTQMGNGNYNLHTEQDYVGEFVEIQESIEKIGEQMRETLRTLRTVSGQIDTGSEQLAYAAEDLAKNCTSQAMQVSGLITTFQEMTSSMEESSKAATESAQMARSAGMTLDKGNQMMLELKQVIGEIGECSSQIGTIIGTIEDIASQTNLLSLNASIEAARAGEAGRGFAVVADQVKNLADESAKAARKTSELIETTITVMDKGISIADETANNMNEVMGAAQAATEKIGQIVQMLNVDVDHMHNVNESIVQVSAAVDNNAATSEETAAVSEEQKAQVETMVQLMSQFNIE